ncbi:MAG: hypothetical protein LUC91_02120, partial [Prevotella sp.]|nr:hypothetical protein [Prevotella sp.]
MDNGYMGSTWSRWDLHIHTPETNKNDWFDGQSPEEKWNNYYQTIEKYMGDGSDPTHVITVMGITDYSSIDNYMKVRNDHRLPSFVKMVLPNVEMRLSIRSSESPINIHFLFDPSFAEQVEARFFAKLTFYSGKVPYSAIKTELIRLGRKGNRSLDEIGSYKRGVDQFLIDFNNLQEIFKKDPELRDHTIIVAPNGSNDGVSGMRGGQSEMLRESVYKFVDAIFSGNPNDRNYFLGKSADTRDDIANKYGALMPCIHGSDAHCLEKIFEPDEQRYCWIKAEPTFEGLKQILYEPEERVIIQAEMPGQKDPHHVIKRVVFHDADFSTDPIYINPNLTCIIGSKSSGKSLFLRQLAHSVSSDYTKKQEENANISRNFLQEDVSVEWNDGVDSDHRNIVYIPQTYLNRIADSEKSNEISKIVERFLCHNMDISQGREKLERVIARIDKEIKAEIDNYLSKCKELKKTEEQLREQGESKSFTAVIDELNEQRKKLALSVNVTQEEMERYMKLDGMIMEDEAHLRQLTDERRRLKSISKLVVFLANSSYQNEDGSFGRMFEEEFHESYSELEFSLSEITRQINERWKGDLQSVTDSISEKADSFEKELDLLKQEYESLKGKVEKVEQLGKITNQIKCETQKRDIATELEHKIEFLKNEIVECKNKVITLHGQFKTAYDEYCGLVGEADFTSSTTLKFSAMTSWKRNEYTRMISNIFDHRGFNTFHTVHQIDLNNL